MVIEIWFVLTACCVIWCSIVLGRIALVSAENSFKDVCKVCVSVASQSLTTPLGHSKCLCHLVSPTWLARAELVNLVGVARCIARYDKGRRYG
jgi:hypothetical protein